MGTHAFWCVINPVLCTWLRWRVLSRGTDTLQRAIVTVSLVPLSGVEERPRCNRISFIHVSV